MQTRHSRATFIFNTLMLRQNGHHFSDDIFKCIFLNEKVWILIKISLKFVPKGPINNIPALVQIMAWRRSGDKPLSEPVMVSLLTYMCVTLPQWVKSIYHNFQSNLLENIIVNPCMVRHMKIRMLKSCGLVWSQTCDQLLSELKKCK